MSKEDPTEQAIEIDILARATLHRILQDWVEEGWGLFLPEVGQYDYDRVVVCMKAQLPPDVTTDEYARAYKALADRAEKV